MPRLGMFREHIGRFRERRVGKGMDKDNGADYKKVPMKELNEIVGYADKSWQIIYDALMNHPDGVTPNWMVAELMRMAVTAIHVSHSRTLRPIHDQQWQKKHGKTSVYPGAGVFVPYDEEEENESVEE